MFETELEVRQSDINDNLWELTAELVYASQHRDHIRVPKGFITDFASVPRLPFAYLLFGGIAQRPAVIHDFLYSTPTAKRKWADEILLEAMEAVGVSWFQRNNIYWAVRAFGASHKKR